MTTPTTSTSTSTYTTIEARHKTDDGMDLYTKTWKIADEQQQVKARVVFVHGFSDHCDNYAVLFDYFAARGVEVFAFDQRGWGRSVHKKNQRGLTGPTSRVLADITSILSTLLPSSTPTFLMGHSMGGAEILHYAAQGPSSLISQLRGFISSAPLIALHPATRPFRVTVFAGRLAGKILPRRQLVNKLDSQWLSRDPAQNALWEKDELCHDTGTLEGLAGMLDRGLELETGKIVLREGVCEGAKTRLLVLHGTGDHVNDFEGTRRWVERCVDVKDKELKSYEGWYHNMHAEPGNDKIIFATHVTDWILQRSGPLELENKDENAAAAASKPKL